MFSKKFPSKFLLVILLSFLLSSCQTKFIAEKSFVIMGTFCDIKIVDNDENKAKSYLDDIHKLLKEIERQFNFYDNQSRLSKINVQAKSGFVKLSDEESNLLKKSVEYSKLTSGAFDITFYPLWELWKKSEKNNVFPTAGEIEKAKKNVGYKKIIFSKDGKKIKFLSKNLSINLGGLAKEYALRKCYEFAKNRKINSLLVNLGGDVLAIGDGKRNGWIVGIQDSFNSDNILTKINVKNKILLTSGIYQRYVEINGKKYHHIINAKNGYPSDNFASITVIYDIEEKEALPSIVLFLLGQKFVEDYFKSNNAKYFLVDKHKHYKKRL